MRWIACSGLSFSWYAREQAIQRMADPGRTRFLPQQGVESLPGHLGDRAALERLARGADAMIHLVGIIVEQGPQTFAAGHVEGTRAGEKSDRKSTRLDSRHPVNSYAVFCLKKKKKY